MSNFQSKVKKQYEKEGYKVVKLIKLSENGYPDLMAMKEGKAVFIEIKEDGDTLKPLQEMRIDELKANGFEAFCLHKTKGRIYG